MFLLLLACVADPTPVDALAALGPDVTDVLFAARPIEAAAALTSVHWDAPAGAFAPGGPPLGAAAHAYGGTVAVVEEGTPMRVLLRHDGVRLLLWLDLGGLVNVVPTATWVDTSGHAVDGLGAGVRVPAGTWVPDYAGEPAVSLHDVGRSLPIAPPLVEDVWIPDDLREARELAAQLEAPADPVSLPGGTVFWDEDGGGLFRLPAMEGVVVCGEVLARDEELGLLVLVALGGLDAGPLAETVFARGWVEPASASEGSACVSSWPYSRSCGLRIGREAPPELVRPWPLPPGALLHDAPDGAIVGVTERFVELELGDDAGAMPGWEPVLAPSPWGRDVVWVRAEGEPAEPDELALAGWYMPEEIEVRPEDLPPVE